MLKICLTLNLNWKSVYFRFEELGNRILLESCLILFPRDSGRYRSGCHMISRFGGNLGLAGWLI